MPAGVEVLVENGFATIDFVDPKLKGHGLTALLEHTPPEFIETLTRTGPRRLYRVPEGNARAAGLIDKGSRVDELDNPDTSSASHAAGMVLPTAPTSANIHGQVVRTGHYSDAYADGGLLDAPADAESASDGPNDDWSRAALNDFAAGHGVAEPDKLPNKAAVLDAINKA